MTSLVLNNRALIFFIFLAITVSYGYHICLDTKIFHIIISPTFCEQNMSLILEQQTIFIRL